MRSTTFVVALSAAESELSRNLQELVFHLDAKQYVRAGVAIGTIAQLGRRITELAFFASQSVGEEMWDERHQETEAASSESETTGGTEP